MSERHLRGVDTHLAAEAESPALLRIGDEPRVVAEIGHDLVECTDVGDAGRKCDT